MVAESVSLSRINSKKTLEYASYAEIDSNICQTARQPKRLTRFFQQKSASTKSVDALFVEKNASTSRFMSKNGARCPVLGAPCSVLGLSSAAYPS